MTDVAALAQRIDDAWICKNALKEAQRWLDIAAASAEKARINPQGAMAIERMREGMKGASERVTFERERMVRKHERKTANAD